MRSPLSWNNRIRPRSIHLLAPQYQSHQTGNLIILIVNYNSKNRGLFVPHLRGICSQLVGKLVVKKGLSWTRFLFAKTTQKRDFCDWKFCGASGRGSNPNAEVVRGRCGCASLLASALVTERNRVFVFFFSSSTKEETSENRKGAELSFHTLSRIVENSAPVL